MGLVFSILLFSLLDLSYAFPASSTTLSGGVQMMTSVSDILGSPLRKVSAECPIWRHMGDSGSPLICNGQLRGITSFGRKGKCGDPRSPGIYTLLSKKFINWIRKTARGAV